MEAIKALKKALKKKVVDEFEDGTVLRFTSGGKYTYVVIKAAGFWYISSSADFFGVGQRFTFDELVTEILSRSDVTNIEAAVSWTSIA